MTPPNVLAKTIEQVTKIMQSPGCRYVALSLVYRRTTSDRCRKTTVFVQSAETAVELSQTFAAERYVPLDVLRYSADVGEDYVPSSNYRMSPELASTT